MERVSFSQFQKYEGVRNSVFTKENRISFPNKGKKKHPYDSILHWDADIDAFSEQTGGPHTFNHAVLSPQYQRNADGSYTDVGAKPAVDVFGGKKWLRSCGAVQNLLPSGWPFSNTNIAVSTLDDYVKLEKATANGSANVTRAGLPASALYTATITLRAGSGLTGTKFDFGYHYNGFKQISVSSISGPGTYVVTADPLVRISGLSPTEDTTVSFTLTSALETSVIAFFYPCGTASTEVGASVLIKDFIITATAYPVPYVPPGVTQPASNATTTNGSWFSLPDGSPLWQALDGEIQQQNLITNGNFDTNIDGWNVYAPTAAILSWQNGKLRIQNNGNTYGAANQAFSTVVGGLYEISVGITIGGGSPSGFTARARCSNAPDYLAAGTILATTSGTYKFRFSATSTTTYLLLGNRNDRDAYSEFDNISIQRIQPQPLTLATRVRMGVGSADYPNNTIYRLLSANTAGDSVQGISKGGSGESRIVRSNDGIFGVAIPDVPWSRNVIIRRVTQVNTAGTQFRVGYMIEGTHTAIQWSVWVAFDGSFDPSTLYRLMLGYNNPYPMWFNKITAWKKQVTDAEILEA